MIYSLFIRFLSILRLSITIFRGVRITFPSNHFLYTELAYRCNLWPYQLIVFVYYCDKWPRFLEHVQVLYGSHKDRLGPAPINWQFLIINSITTIQVLDRNLYPYAYLSFVYGLWIIIPTEHGPFYCYLGTDICSYKYTQHIKILYPHLYTGNPILIISICNMLRYRLRVCNQNGVCVCTYYVYVLLPIYVVVFSLTFRKRSDIRSLELCTTRQPWLSRVTYMYMYLFL